MFVFIGFCKESPENKLENLLERLNLVTKPILNFTRKNQLLMAQLDDIFFYASISNKKNELKDWIQMAKDFELSIDLTELDQNRIVQKYERLKKLYPNLYDDLHYSLADAMFKEMSKISNLSIYSFE